MADERPYQHESQIAQLEAERANAVAYDQKDRVAAVDKQLAEFGVKKKAAEKRAAADEDAKNAPPKGRRSSEKTEG